MILLQFLVLLFFIFLGARVGGIGVGFAGGAGVLALGFLGATPGSLPMLVIVFITVVIVAVSAMQISGGMDYLVQLTDRFLRRHPRYIALLAPFVTYMLTLMASTGQVSFATMPVIVEVCKENNIRPTRALSVGVAGSLLGITASPISAAVVFLSGILEKGKSGWGYLELIAVSIPATFLGVMCTALFFMLWDKARGHDVLDQVPEYRKRLAEGQIRPREQVQRTLKPGARKSVFIFLIGLVVVLGYAILISPKLGIIENPAMDGGQARIATMLTVALLIVVLCKADIHALPQASVFRTGMTACVCILGVAWLGTTFMDNHQAWISSFAADSLRSAPWLLALVLMIASALLYSQAATAKALLPTALALGIEPGAVVACFPAVSALFILPTYPTLLAAVDMDDTGSTQLGTRIIDHPFLIPGLMATGLSVAFGFLLARIVVP